MFIFFLDSQKPVFKSNILTMDQLSVGLEVHGVVRNTTSFGAFVDIGVNNNALIHKSKFSGKTLGPGDIVNCRICDLDLTRKRISLALF